MASSLNFSIGTRVDPYSNLIASTKVAGNIFSTLMAKQVADENRELRSQALADRKKQWEAANTRAEALAARQQADYDHKLNQRKIIADVGARADNLVAANYINDNDALRNRLNEKAVSAFNATAPATPEALKATPGEDPVLAKQRRDAFYASDKGKSWLQQMDQKRAEFASKHGAAIDNAYRPDSIGKTDAEAILRKQLLSRGVDLPSASTAAKTLASDYTDYVALQATEDAKAKAYNKDALERAKVLEGIAGGIKPTGLKAFTTSSSSKSGSTSKTNNKARADVLKRYNTSFWLPNLVTTNDSQDAAKAAQSAVTALVGGGMPTAQARRAVNSALANSIDSATDSNFDREVFASNLDLAVKDYETLGYTGSSTKSTVVDKGSRKALLNQSRLAQTAAKGAMALAATHYSPENIRSKALAKQMTALDALMPSKKKQLPSAKVESRKRGSTKAPAEVVTKASLAPEQTTTFQEAPQSSPVTPASGKGTGKDVLQVSRNPQQNTDKGRQDVVDLLRMKEASPEADLQDVEVERRQLLDSIYERKDNSYFTGTLPSISELNNLSVPELKAIEAKQLRNMALKDTAVAAGKKGINALYNLNKQVYGSILDKATDFFDNPSNLSEAEARLRKTKQRDASIEADEQAASAELNRRAEILRGREAVLDKANNIVDKLPKTQIQELQHRLDVLRRQKRNNGAVDVLNRKENNLLHRLEALKSQIPANVPGN